MHHLWIPVYVKCSFTIAKEKDCVVYMSESRLIEWMQLWCRHEWRTSRLITAVFSSLSLPSRYFSHLKLMTWDHCISPPVRPKTTAKQSYHHSGKRGEDWGGRGILPAGSFFWVVFFYPLHCYTGDTSKAVRMRVYKQTIIPILLNQEPASLLWKQDATSLPAVRFW